MHGHHRPERTTLYGQMQHHAALFAETKGAG
jgi:hypothetical protein